MEDAYDIDEFSFDPVKHDLGHDAKAVDVVANFGAFATHQWLGRY
jgi:hypothetical protein